ncbi:MAG: DMT family transporter [Pseudomonadota bacterium]
MIDLKNPSNTVASAAVFISATVWGLYWVPLRIFEADGIEGGWSVTLLNAPPLLILIPLLLWSWGETKAFMGRGALIGVFAGLGLACYASGLVYSSVVRVTLLFYLMPVWGTLIGWIWLGERVGWQRWAAIGTGLLGMVLLLSGGAEASVPLNIGDFLGFLSGVLWAVAAALIRQNPGLPLSASVGFQFFFTAAGAALIAVILGPAEPPALGDVIAALPLAAFASIGFILPTVWIIFWAQQFLFPGRAGLLMMSEVMVAVLSASLFLPEEAMTGREWIGAGLIIAACLIEVLATPGEAHETRRQNLV